MSTNSFIGIIEHNVLKGIYCHADGYPAFNGKMLNEYYKNDSKIYKLIDLGFIYSLGKYVSPYERQTHNFEYRQENVVLAYGRDRGEKNVEAVEFQNVKAFKDFIKNSFIRYIYIRYNHEWYVVKQINNKTIDLIKLVEVLENTNKEIGSYKEFKRIKLNN